jgi:hypothetical protein
LPDRHWRKRVEEVLSLRLLGAEFVDIRHHASEKEWNVSDRQLWRYIAAGDAILAETLERDRSKLLDRHIAQRRGLYARAMAVSDYGTALRVLQDEAALLALYPPKRTEVSGRDGGAVLLNIWAPALQKMTDGELATLARLAEQLPQANGAPINGTGDEDSTHSSATGVDLSGAVSPVLPQLCGPHVDPE